MKPILSGVITVLLLLQACSPAPKHNPPPKPGTPFWHVLEGEKHERAGRLAEAVKEYTKAIEMEPKNYQAYSFRARVFAKTGNMKESMSDYDVLLGPNQTYLPNQWYTILSRGESLAILGEYYLAMEDFSRVQKLNPKDSRSFLYRGSAWLALDEYQKALSDFNQAIARTQYYTYHYYRSMAYEGLGDLSMAIAEMQTCLQLGGPYIDEKYRARLKQLQENTASANGNSDEAPDLSRIQLSIHQLGVSPSSVLPGGTMEMMVEYGLSDEFIAFDVLSLLFTYTISKGNQILFRSEAQKIFAPHNQSIIRKVTLKAGRIPGDYMIEVFFKYKTIVRSKRVDFKIS